MLGNLYTGRRDHHRGCCGNIEGIGVVTAGTDNLQYVHPGMFDRGCMAPHGNSAAGNLIDGLCLGTLGRECRQKCCILGGRRLSVHDLVHDGLCLLERQVLLCDNFNDGFFDHYAAPF